MRSSLALTLLISIVLHVALLLFGPTFHLDSTFATGPGNVEVELVRREIPIPDALRPSPLPEIPLPDPLDLSRLSREDAPPARDLNLDVKEKFAIPAPAELPGSRPLPEAPSFDAPVPAVTPGAIVPLKEVEAEAGADEIVLPPAPKAPPGLSQGLKERREVSLPEDDVDGPLLEELSRLGPLPGAPAQARQHATIQGPAAKRKILFRPIPPRPARLDDTAEIVLKFWVLSDGTVGRVVPIKKANAYLESLASNHLKRWRFSPLLRGEDADEQWGEITFRFLLR